MRCHFSIQPKTCKRSGASHKQESQEPITARHVTNAIFEKIPACSAGSRSWSRSPVSPANSERTNKINQGKQGLHFPRSIKKPCKICSALYRTLIPCDHCLKRNVVVSVTRAMLVSSRYMLLLTNFRTRAAYHKSAIKLTMHVTSTCLIYKKTAMKITGWVGNTYTCNNIVTTLTTFFAKLRQSLSD